MVFLLELDLNERKRMCVFLCDEEKTKPKRQSKYIQLPIIVSSSKPLCGVASYTYLSAIHRTPLLTRIFTIPKLEESCVLLRCSRLLNKDDSPLIWKPSLAGTMSFAHQQYF